MRPFIAKNKNSSSKNLAIQIFGNSRRSLAPWKWLALPFASVSLGGCSTHPIQQDVTGLPTKQIVDRIRCEVKYAVLDKAIDKLRTRAEEFDQTHSLPNVTAAQKIFIVGELRRIAHKLEAEGRAGGRIDFDPTTLPTEKAIRFYNHFINSGIAYDFTFDITESNLAGAAVDPVRIITGGTAGLTLGGSFDRTRSNIRRFQLTDTFGGLLANDQLMCGLQDTVTKNLAYPVAGNIGLYELVGTFVDLSESQLLQALAPQGASVFADTLKFTTTLSGGATPHIELAAVGNRFGLASPTNVALRATRIDTHTLGISMSMGAEGTVPLVKPSLVRRSPDGRRVVRTLSYSAPNIRRALDSLEIQRARNITDNLGTLVGR